MENDILPISEQEQQPQEQEIPVEQYTRVQDDEKLKNFLSQTSPTKTLESLNYKLQGFEWDFQKQEWVKVSEGLPDKMRIDILQFLTPHLSEDTRMTNLSETQIRNIMYVVIEWIHDYFEDLGDEENIPETQLTKYVNIVLSAVYYTLLRSQNGVERINIFGSLSMAEQLNPYPQMRQESAPWWQIWK